MNVTVNVLSSKRKDYMPKPKRGKTQLEALEPIQGAIPTLYLTLAIELHTSEGKLIAGLSVSGVRVSGGVIKPPAAFGSFRGAFFPQVWFTNGLQGNELAQAIYTLVKRECEEKGLPELGVFEDAMEYWLPQRQLETNLGLENKNIIYRS